MRHARAARAGNNYSLLEQDLHLSWQFHQLKGNIAICVRHNLRLGADNHRFAVANADLVSEISCLQPEVSQPQLQAKPSLEQQRAMLADVHNSDADERAGRGRCGCLLRGRPPRRRRTQRQRRRALAATGAGGEDGRAAPRDVDVASAGGAGSWLLPVPEARTGALSPGTWPWPAPAAQRRGRMRFLSGSFVCLL